MLKRRKMNENVSVRNTTRFSRVQGLLDSGITPNRIFDYVAGVSCGFHMVKLRDKQNYISGNGEGYTLLSEQWFDQCCPFTRVGEAGGRSFAKVRVGDKWNIIRDDGTLFIEGTKSQWFDSIGATYSRLVDVSSNGERKTLTRIDILGNGKITNKTQKNDMKKKVRLTESQFRNFIGKCVRRVLSEKVGDIRTIHHGDWADPEVEYEKSHWQKPLYNYWDMEDMMSQEEYDEFHNIGDRKRQKDIMRKSVEDLKPQGYSKPQMYYEYEINDEGCNRTFTTKSACLKAALETGETGELIIWLYDGSNIRGHWLYDIANGTILKDRTPYEFDKDKVNAPLKESLRLSRKKRW